MSSDVHSQPDCQNNATASPKAAEVGDLDQDTVLSLTPFERYMVVDARPGYPMTFPIEVRVIGAMDETRFSEVFHQVLKHHPLLSARLTPEGWRLGFPPSWYEWFEQSSSLPPVGYVIDPSTQPPLVVRVFTSPQETILQLIVHHGASDGLGLFQFAFDLIDAYRGIAKRRQVTNPIARLSQRADYQFTPPVVISRWQSRRFLIREAFRFAWVRPVALGNRQPTAHDHAPIPLQTRVLDQETYGKLTELAQNQNLTLNTLLLAVTFHVLAKCSSTQKPKKVIRITLPVSMRQRQDLRLSAANKIGYAFIDRRIEQCDDPLGLAMGLQNDIDTILDWSLAGMFSQAVGTIDRIPGALKLATRLFGRASTAVFSNVGDVGRRFRVPRVDANDHDNSAPVDLAWGAPPVRPGTAVAIATVTVHGSIAVSMARDPNRVSEIQGEQILDQYTEACHQLLENASHPHGTSQ